MKTAVNIISEKHDGKSTISTLVFMDLEATGLPSFVGKKNVHITEMSFIAIDRKSFETDSSLRVLNKLSLCIRPRATISPTAMSITGLYNDVLETQEKFDDSIPKLLEYFFRRLQRPICLLAHNGNRYDFPLLQAELQNINYSLDPQILCADTLQAIRFIVLNPVPVLLEDDVKRNGPLEDVGQDNNPIIQPLFLKDDIKRNTPLEDNDPEVEILLTQDIDIFNAIEEPKVDLKSSSNCHLKNVHQTVAAFTLEDEKTPPKTFTSESISTNPSKKAKLNTTSLSENHKNGGSTNFHHVQARRQLFPDEKVANKSDANVTPSKPVHFSLEKLYDNFFGKSPPTSHYAEADCIALSKVCQHVNKGFLKWIDENSSPFCETKAMW